LQLLKAATGDFAYQVKQFTGAVNVLNPITGKHDLRVGDILNEKQANVLASHYTTTTV
jgi:hypothetical protein